MRQPPVLGRLALCAVLALGAGTSCGGEDDETPRAAAAPRGRGPGRGVGAPSLEPAAPAAEAPSTGTRRRGAGSEPTGPTRPGAGPGTSTARLPSSVTATGPATGEDDEREARPGSDGPRERDLGAELETAMGSLEPCLDLETARRLEGSLRVPIRAEIVGSGRITRATASAGALSRDQNACIARIVEHASLRGPIPDAPRTITTTVEMSVELTEPDEDEE